MLLASLICSTVLARHFNFRESALGSFMEFLAYSIIIGMLRHKRGLRERDSTEGKRHASDVEIMEEGGSTSEMEEDRGSYIAVPTRSRSVVSTAMTASEEHCNIDVLETMFGDTNLKANFK